MFNAKDHKEKTGGLPKTLNPGEHYCKIVKIQMNKPPYADASKDDLNLLITLEGVDLGEEFQGFAIDKTNPSLGNYKGQIGTVQAGQYPFSTYSYNGKLIERDMQIYRWINNLAKQMGVLNKIQDDNIEANTIEEYVEKVSSYLTKSDLWGMFCISGKEYTNDAGYPAYRLFFPKAGSGKYPFAACGEEDPTPSSFLNFKDEFIKKQEKASTSSSPEFETENSAVSPFFDTDTRTTNSLDI